MIATAGCGFELRSGSTAVAARHFARVARSRGRLLHADKEATVRTEQYRRCSDAHHDRGQPVIPVMEANVANSRRRVSTHIQSLSA